MRESEVDIVEILDDVSRVLRARDTGSRESYHSEVREVDEIIYLLPGVWENISNSLVALDQALAPLETAGAEEPGAPPVGGGGIKAAVKRFILKAVYWYVNPIVAQLHSVHGSTARALHEIADQLRNINDRLEGFERENVVGRLKNLEGERFDERIGRLERSWRQAGQRPETTGPQQEGASAPVETGSYSEVQLRGVGKDRSVSRDAVSPFPAFHFDYYWFESIHRGDRTLIKRRQQQYLEYFRGCDNVLDVGCGRGEFLELMKERDIGGYGIDLESDAVQYCLDAGLPAVQGEALEHLDSLENECLDGMFISQIAEHLTPSELVELIGISYRKLQPESNVVIETPNPQCLLIFASFFYADLSHVQPIHPETMRFLLLSAGFKDVKVKFTNPVPKNQRLSRIPEPEAGGEEPWVKELNRNFDKLNSVLFSHMDYCAVARK